MEKFVLDSPALVDAVKLRSTANYPPRRPGRSSLKEVQATGGAGAEYNGYFTIKDVSTYNEDGTIKEHRVAVCDGATWDPETETSHVPMTAYVNNMSATIKSVVFTLPHKNWAHWHIKLYVVDRRKYPDSIVLYPSDYMGLMLYVYDSYEESTPTPEQYANYLIGEIHPSYGLIQRHISGIGNGIPRIWVQQSVCIMETEDAINPNV